MTTLVTPLSLALIEPVEQLMKRGEPFVRARTASDYWLYAQLFSSSCPVVLIDGIVTGAAIAFRSQDQPDDVYIQDVMTAPERRGRGIARTLLTHIHDQAARWGAKRVYLTSEPDNIAAQNAWAKAGYVNRPGDFSVDGIQVVRDFKGPGKHRAVYDHYLE
jgi:ribosomal protein S18 acetylase RimI-like enzyme